MKAALSLTLIALLGTGCIVKKNPNSEVMDLNDTPPSEPTQSVEPVTAVQPVQTPAPVQSEPAPVAAPRTHTIAAGDTLWSLAVKYYGDGKQSKKILEANPGLEPTRMSIGKKITIP